MVVSYTLVISVVLVKTGSSHRSDGKTRSRVQAQEYCGEYS